MNYTMVSDRVGVLVQPHVSINRTSEVSIPTAVPTLLPAGHGVQKPDEHRNRHGGLVVLSSSGVSVGNHQHGCHGIRGYRCFLPRLELQVSDFPSPSPLVEAVCKLVFVA